MTDNVPTLEEFTGLKLAGLDDYDIAILNLCAARGLPGTETLDIDPLLETLDHWAHQAKLEIWRHLYQFDSQASQPPTEFSYGNSLGRFFCWYMLQCLQEDCQVVYNEARKFNPDFCQPEDLFIHGIVEKDGQGGTCASMPVVYVAVARRLGLPVYLVQTRGHLFFRWGDPLGTTIHWKSPPLDLWIPPDRFNVEGSGEGIAYYPDSHYIQWPELWQEVDFNHGQFLRSMNATEVLADFLIQRSECFYELGNWEECLKDNLLRPAALARRRTLQVAAFHPQQEVPGRAGTPRRDVAGDQRTESKGGRARPAFAAGDARTSGESRSGHTTSGALAAWDSHPIRAGR